MLRCLIALFAIVCTQFHSTAAAAAQDAPPAAGPLTFSVTYDPAICDTFTGRVYLMFGAGPGEPRQGPSWFGTAPFFALDVKDWKPDSPLIFDDKAIAFPEPLSKVKSREWSVQAVMRRNLDSPSIGQGADDAYSASLRQKLDGSVSGKIEIRIDKTLIVPPLRETDRIKIVSMKSDMLSYFHARPIE